MTQNAKNTWLVNGLLAVILALLAAWYMNVPEQRALAAGGGWETNGILATSISGPNEHLVLVDTKKQNIMIYKTLGSGQFRLMGARSYKYDVEIEDTAGTEVEKGDGITSSDAYKEYQRRDKKTPK